MRPNDHILLEHFSNYMTSLNRSAATVRNYRYNISRFLFWIADKKIDSCLDISWHDIEKYQLYLLKQPQYRVISVETYLRAIRAFYKYLRRQGFINTDPALLVQLPKHHRSLPRNVLTKAECKRLLNAPDINTDVGVLHRTILEVFYGTAIRLSELCSLSLCDINTYRRELRVRGKGNRDRIQPLTETVYEWIKIYTETIRPTLLNGRTETRLFIGSLKGRPLNSQIVETIVRRYARQAKIKKKVTPHTIRATTATHMLKKGAALTVVQAILGHSLISTTERYTRVAAGDLTRAIRKYHPREKVMNNER